MPHVPGKPTPACRWPAPARPPTRRLRLDVRTHPCLSCCELSVHPQRSLNKSRRSRVLLGRALKNGRERAAPRTGRASANVASFEERPSGRWERPAEETLPGALRRSGGLHSQGENKRGAWLGAEGRGCLRLFVREVGACSLGRLQPELPVSCR